MSLDGETERHLTLLLKLVYDRYGPVLGWGNARFVTFFGTFLGATDLVVGFFREYFAADDTFFIRVSTSIWD